MCTAVPNAEKSQPPIGIDLGTTLSVVAFLDSTGRPTTVANNAGDLLTPSCVLFEDEGVVVGKEAFKNAVLDPDSYAECFKRDMGCRYHKRRVRGQQVPPEVLSAFVLERLKKDAERRLGPIRDVVNEPTAAALAFGYQQGFVRTRGGAASSPPRRVLVYDLGGGTFDVTVLEIARDTFRALATDGDVLLGGKDFDERLFNHLAEKFLAAHGADPRSDPQDAAQLWRDAEEAKHALSERAKTTALAFHAGIRMRIDVTRQEFEDLTRDLLERTRTTTALVMQQASLSWDLIDRVLLVGGSTRMPMVSEMLRELSGKEPDRSVSPDEAVAHGAALYAGMLSSSAEPSAERCRLINVNSHRLAAVGIDPRTGRKATGTLVRRNTPLPHHAVKRFRTSKDNQRSIAVTIVEGESRRPEDCVVLGRCVVRELMRGLPKGAEVLVEFHYQANGRISVTARVPSTRQSGQVQIVREQPHELEGLDVWRRRLCGPTAAGAALPSAVGSNVATGVAPKKPGDAGFPMERLDALYTQLGQRAVDATLPSAMQASRQAALNAVRELNELQSKARKIEKKQQASGSRAETVQQGAQLAQARLAIKSAQVKANFALLVLGRECAGTGIELPGAEPELREIRRLARELSS